jgi:ubiquinone/menaquinone biosynthesis C-methylase UbiE
MTIIRGKNFGMNLKEYVHFRKPYPRTLFEELFKMRSSPRHPCKILDLGCGTGLSTEPLIKKNISVTGLDPDGRMIGYARRHAKKAGLFVNYTKGVAEHLPFDDESFDAITIGSAFHWFSNKKSMQEIYRVLKKKGVIFLYWLYEDDPIQMVPREVFRSYGVKRIQKRKTNPNDVFRFLGRYGFNSLKTSSVAYRVKFSIREWIGSAKTASDFSLLSKSEKKSFVKDLTLRLKELFKSKKTLEVRRIIHICSGKKEE